jgi:hypothetical protein
VAAAVFGTIPAARVQHNDNPVTTQSIPSGVFTNVSFDVEVYDTDNMFDPMTPTRLTFNTPGVYLVTGAARWADNATGRRAVGIVPNANGIAFLAADTRDATASGASRQNVSTTARFQAGDFIELKVEQTSGAPLDLTNLTSPQIHLSATWLGP